MNYKEIKIKNPMEDSAFIYKDGDLEICRIVGVKPNEKLVITNKQLYEKHKHLINK